MKIQVVVDKKEFFDLDRIKELKEFWAHSWEGYSSLTVKYDEEQDLLVIEYGAEWPWLHVGDGKEIKLF